MKRKEGFTLVEGVCSLLIITMVLIGVLNFYKITNKRLLITENQTIINGNLRIAQEFLVEKIRKSNSIKVNGNLIFIDENHVYIEKNILRYGTSSQQISPNISNVSIENMGGNTYKVITSGEFETLSTVVKRGDRT